MQWYPCHAGNKHFIMSFLFLFQSSRSLTKPTYFMPCAPQTTMTLSCANAGGATGDISVLPPALELNLGAATPSEKPLYWPNVRRQEELLSCNNGPVCIHCTVQRIRVAQETSERQLRNNLEALVSGSNRHLTQKCVKRTVILDDMRRETWQERR